MQAPYGAYVYTRKARAAWLYIGQYGIWPIYILYICCMILRDFATGYLLICIWLEHESVFFGLT
jgi:hypothetical protein